MAYTRVIPRDLFNESKLLKCLARLSLLIHDGMADGRLCLKLYDAEQGFKIEQDAGSGDLYCVNLVLTIGREEIGLASVYNSKAAYPLMFNDRTGPVFDKDGAFADEFLDWLEQHA